MRPVYEKVLRKSGVLGQESPRVYDIAGGSGILFHIAKDLRSGRVWEDYHLVDENENVLRIARRRGIRNAHRGSLVSPPKRIRDVDHAFFLFPTVSGREGINILRATEPLMKKGGRITLLGGIEDSSKTPPSETPSRNLKLVHYETIQLTPEQLEVLRGYEDFNLTDWRNGLRLMVYKKTDDG